MAGMAESRHGEEGIRQDEGKVHGAPHGGEDCGSAEGCSQDIAGTFSFLSLFLPCPLKLTCTTRSRFTESRGSISRQLVQSFPLLRSLLYIICSILVIYILGIVPLISICTSLVKSFLPSAALP
jgi:hypothetical protein